VESTKAKTGSDFVGAGQVVRFVCTLCTLSLSCGYCVQHTINTLYICGCRRGDLLLYFPFFSRTLNLCAYRVRINGKCAEKAIREVGEKNNTRKTKFDVTDVTGARQIMARK
jgi:hypothetical protein